MFDSDEKKTSINCDRRYENESKDEEKLSKTRWVTKVCRSLDRHDEMNMIFLLIIESSLIDQFLGKFKVEIEQSFFFRFQSLISVNLMIRG